MDTSCPNYQLEYNTLTGVWRVVEYRLGAKTPVAGAPLCRTYEDICQVRQQLLDAWNHAAAVEAAWIPGTQTTDVRLTMSGRLLWSRRNITFRYPPKSWQNRDLAEMRTYLVPFVGDPRPTEAGLQLAARLDAEPSHMKRRVWGVEMVDYDGAGRGTMLVHILYPYGINP